MNENVIKYDDKIIEYTIDKAKRKNVYIVVKNGKVIIKVPVRFNINNINKIIESKKNWIYKKTINVINIIEKEYINNEVFKILGNSYKLKICFDYIKKSNIVIKDENLIVVLPIKYCNEDVNIQKKEIEKIVNKLYYNLTENQLKEKLEKITNKVLLYPIEYKIKKLKRAWGSCSIKKIITINQKLSMFNEDVIEYVVLHEVCHLKYMNHSKYFWNMVKYYMPNYLLIRKELKEY